MLIIICRRRMLRASCSLSLPFAGCPRRSKLLMRPPLLSVPLDVPRHNRVTPFEVIVAAKRPERNGYIGVDLQSPRSKQAHSNVVSGIDESAPRPRR